MSIQSDAAKKHIENLLHHSGSWIAEYKFHPKRKWRFDYAIPDLKFAIELDGGLFIKGAHSNPAAIEKNMEKMNMAASMGWRVWRYTPRMVIKAGRKTMPDEPVLLKLPWDN